MTETGPSRTRRVFFALWPPPEALEGLDDLAGRVSRRCEGRRTARDSLHMTLAFVGAVTQEQLDRLLAIGGRIQGEAFAMNIDRLGYWPHNRIIWAGCSEVPSCQRRLYDSLAGDLLAEGFRLDQRPFVPHITLARKARCGELPRLERPIRWPVTEFALVESLPQPAERQYLSLSCWPLPRPLDEKI
ncbi:RNA 2',3'-cyclic phosphodiesterase [Sulfuricystis multivorans]|uniref:RNA 2',3'-cyclic phosphodiesterase n=1 Tax=Sulfuricystis multivorans TaxID=2211108 RepID=UPI000F834FC8|nr:RNA 2',3'-cyclic phosphodiesterase [Sulfuricystis multivorans]